MKKRISTLMILILLCVAWAIPGFAAKSPLLMDEANLLSASEEAVLLTRLNGLSKEYDLDVVIVTMDSLGFHDADSFADNYYNDHGYGDNGILLLLSMEDRDWAITATGYGRTAFTDAGMEYISEQILPDLGDDEFYDAFDRYTDLCADFLAQAASGDPFDGHNLPKDPFNWVLVLAVSLAVGFVVALIITAVMKSGLKSVRFQAAAKGYVKPGSMKLNQSREFFLYRHVSKVKKPESSSSGSTRSSGGRTFSGRSGKF